MIIKASAALRNDYASISNLAKESNEPIYITKNGEGDMVLMSIEAYEKREQLLQLRAKVLQAEQERIDGAPTISVAGSYTPDIWLNERGYKMVICKKHVAIYRRIQECIYVYHIADTQTDYTKLFK